MIEIIVAPQNRKEELWELFVEYAHELSNYDGEPRPRTVHHYPGFDSYWESEDRIPFLIIYDHEPVGFCLMQDTGVSYQIKEFYVRPLHRRRGFAKLAVAFVKDYCIKLGRHKQLSADIYINNEPAIKFWQSVGFRDTGRRGRLKNSRLMETEADLTAGNKR